MTTQTLTGDVTKLDPIPVDFADQIRIPTAASRAVVLLSGGQDSTTCWYWACQQYDHVEAVLFDYGQRHRVELELAKDTASYGDRLWRVLPVEALQKLAGASLTSPDIANTEGGAPAEDGWHARHKLPPSFVPGRNALFFSLAAAYAIPRDITTIVTGVCETDHAGYPDCRAIFVEQMQAALQFALDTPEFRIVAPLLHKSKAETWAMAEDLGVLDAIIHRTNTCYEGDRTHLHEWGFGCGLCGACTERANGYDEFKLL